MKSLIFIAIVTCVIAAVDGQSVLTSRSLGVENKKTQIVYYNSGQNNSPSISIVSGKDLDHFN